MRGTPAGRSTCDSEVVSLRFRTAVEPDAEHPGLVRADRVGAHAIAQVGAGRSGGLEGGGRKPRRIAGSAW